MIGKTLEFIRGQVNEFINQKIDGPSSDSRVVLTSFVDDAGGIAIPNDTVGLCQLAVNEEKAVRKAGLIPTRKSESTTQFVYAPIYINLQIMFAARFSNYQEGLKHISYVMSYFQRHPVLSPDDIANMKTLELPDLNFRLHNISLEQQHYIWNLVGIKYRPHAIYNIRLLAVFEDDIVKEVTNIQTLDVGAAKKETGD